MLVDQTRVFSVARWLHYLGRPRQSCTIWRFLPAYAFGCSQELSMFFGGAPTAFSTERYISSQKSLTPVTAAPSDSSGWHSMRMSTNTVPVCLRWSSHQWVIIFVIVGSIHTLSRWVAWASKHLDIWHEHRQPMLDFGVRACLNICKFEWELRCRYQPGWW